jgi:DNA-binding response OmpR family regulator
MSEENQPPSTPKEILVVDDTPASLRLLTELLTGHGYRIRPAQDGAMALESVAAKIPDLILLDVNMPGMDGYEVCRRLKADEKRSRIPVIFISAFGDTRQKVTGFEAGGLDFITKPFEAEEVLARVRTHLRLRQAEEALRIAHNTLELRVQERTAELQESEEKARRAFEEIKVLKSQLELHNTYLQEEVVEAKAFGDLVGQSSGLRNLVSQIDVVAPTEASVLILGETGTGKPTKSTAAVLAKTAHWYVSIAPPSQGSCSKVSFLAMCEALLRER